MKKKTIVALDSHFLIRVRWPIFLFCVSPCALCSITSIFWEWKIVFLLSSLTSLMFPTAKQWWEFFHNVLFPTTTWNPNFQQLWYLLVISYSERCRLVFKWSSPERSIYRIVLGDHDMKEVSGREQTFEISKLIVHPDYNDVDTLDNDIALMKVSSFSPPFSRLSTPFASTVSHTSQSYFLVTV